jgi:hypothetical protein
VRQLFVQVPAEAAGEVVRLAGERGAEGPVSLPAEGRGGAARRLVVASLPNAAVGDFVAAVDAALEDATFVLVPGVLPLRSPLDEVRHRVRDVDRRSTLELVLGALQSVGSWRGLIFYALFSGVIAAYGLLVNASYMLVAAMLVAPVGAPVMVATVGAAVGDARMVGRGALRFLAATCILVAAAVGMGFAYGLTASTAMMEQVASLSLGGALVALAAGAAGAQSLVQSERTSLVAATAAGFLVAAALSPTAAVLGLAVPLQRWDYAGLMAFQLALQFAALALGGWLILTVYGVRPADASAGRGSGLVRGTVGGGLAVAVAGLLALQLALQPGYVKADRARGAEEAAVQAIGRVADAGLVEVEARFTRADLRRHPGETLLLEVRVEAPAGMDAAGERELAARVREAVRRAVAGVDPRMVPLVDVTVLPGG